MPPENPKKFEEIKRTAIQEAENRTKLLEQYAQGEIPEVIDSAEEVDLFFETVYTLINKYIDETNDPALTAKKQELETVYKDQKAKKEKYYSDAEKTADEYWESLLAIMEKEERQAINHGQDLLKSLGIAGSCKIVSYGKYKNEKAGGEVHSYEIEKDHFTYHLYFKPNGEIEISFEIGGETSKYLHLYQSQDTNYGENRQFLEKTVSLSELKDLSAFKIHLSKLDSELSWIIDGIKGTLDYLPKRSTKPELQPLMEFRDELSRLSGELSDTRQKQRQKQNQNRDLTQEQYDHYLGKIGECFRKRLRQYFDAPDKTNLGTEELRKSLSRLIDEHPHLIDAALEEIKTVEELQLFRFDKNYENYLYAKVECKRDKLPKTGMAEIDKELDKYRLPPEYRETLLALNGHGFVKKEDFPEFIPILKLVGLGALGEYLKFVIDHPSYFMDKKTLMLFTSFSKGLSGGQFEHYLDYWRDDKAFRNEWNLKDLNTILRGYNEDEDLDLAYLLFERGEWRFDKVRKLIARIKALSKKKKIEIWKIQSHIREFTKWGPDSILTALEILDSEYLDTENNSYFALMTRGFSEFSMKERHFKKLNALKKFQRKGLECIKGLFGYFPEKDSDEFLDTLSHVQSDPEMEYVSLIVCLPGNHLGVEEFSKTAIEAAKHKKIWEEMTKVQETKNKKFQERTYEIIKLMLDRDLDEQTIVDMIPDLAEIETDIQKKTIVLLITKENAKELVKAMALCGEQCRDIYYSYNSNLTGIYYKAISQKPPISSLLDLIQRLAAVQNNEKSLIKRNGIMLIMAGKTSNYEELLEVVASIENQEFIAEFKKVTQSEEFGGTGFSDVEDFAEIYFRIAISPSDLKDARGIMQGLKTFLVKAVRERYDIRTDPGLNKATSFLDPIKLLEKEDAYFSHIAFILNILQGSSPEFSREKLTETALKFLESSKTILQEKGAKLLIGLGTITQTLDQKIIIEIARKGVDNKLTHFTLSDKITTDHLTFLRQQGSPQIPLSLYFSFLITLEQTSKSKDKPAFESLVRKYKDIENEAVYRGEVLILSHNPKDETHSYLFAQDSFNSEAHKIFAEDIQGLHVETLRHGEDNESIESMFSKLEMIKGDSTLIIGGHGMENFISFGGEWFNIDKLFERLKRRVKQQKEGNKWLTTIIFKSCYSDYNIRLLNKLWFEDSETKDFPIRMLSSSNENMSNDKMAGDSWIIKARESKTTRKLLTWAEFYRDIESRNFIMSDGESNSNPTLFINGEELGALEKPEKTVRKTA
ncbi:MAG: hypothetical protein WC604_03550 [Candidatus Gracilibacteria bacterium]